MNLKTRRKQLEKRREAMEKEMGDILDEINTEKRRLNRVNYNFIRDRLTTLDDILAKEGTTDSTGYHFRLIGQEYKKVDSLVKDKLKLDEDFEVVDKKIRFGHV